MHLAYLTVQTVEKPERVAALERAGYTVTCISKIGEAEQLLEKSDCRVLLYAWPFAGELFWVKKRFTTVAVNPSLKFEDFVKGLGMVLPV